MRSVTLTNALAVESGVQVYRIGDSGARAAWAGTQYVTQSVDARGPGDEG